MEQNKIRTIEGINICSLLAGVVIARLSCVALSNVFVLTIGFVLAYAITFVALMIFSLKKLTKTETYALFSLSVYVVEVIASCVVLGESLFGTQAFNIYIIIILFFLYLYIKRMPREKQKVFFMIALTGFVATFIYSIIKLAEDPTLSRLAATGRYGDDTIDTLKAVGGFDTVYGGLFVFVALTYMRSFLDRKGMKIFALVAIVSCVVFIIMATYATAIVLLVFTFALILFKKGKKSAILVLVLLLLGSIYHEMIGEWIMQWSRSIKYSQLFEEKMYQIGYMIRYGENVGTLAGEEGRWARIGWSLNAFFEYPVLGAFSKSGVKIGSHSELADVLGRFGIVGFTSLLSFFVFVFKDIAKGMCTKIGKDLMFVSVVLYLAMAVLDPALYTQQVLPIFILIPFVEAWAIPQGD